jgi:hypothetical protein
LVVFREYELGPRRIESLHMAEYELQLRDQELLIRATQELISLRS